MVNAIKRLILSAHKILKKTLYLLEGYDIFNIKILSPRNAFATTFVLWEIFLQKFASLGLKCT